MFPLHHHHTYTHPTHTNQLFTHGFKKITLVYEQK